MGVFVLFRTFAARFLRYTALQAWPARRTVALGLVMLSRRGYGKAAAVGSGPGVAGEGAGASHGSNGDDGGDDPAGVPAAYHGAPRRGRSHSQANRPAADAASETSGGAGGGSADAGGSSSLRSSRRRV